MGDSFTFGAEVNDNETWPSHLQNFSKTTVLNGGVVGFGLDQTYLLFEELITQNNFKPSCHYFSNATQHRKNPS
ncbi:MAG: hypothetical protein EBQ85_11920 [Proteobacteria bacterium]|nr:hypothetical protein [Pseudomonadota bacterium]